MITSYTFGNITIDGRAYTSDLIIAGAGAQGRMVPAWDLKPCLAEKNIDIEFLDTVRAVDLYNQLLTRGHAPAACFHLTC